jgi:hypothetical protein
MNISRCLFAMLAGCLVLGETAPAEAASLALPDWYANSAERLEKELVARHGPGQQERAKRGLRQVASLWRSQDGDLVTFEVFARANFAGDMATRDALFNRLERLTEKIDGHMTELRYELRRQTDLDLGTVLPADEVLSGYEPAAHVLDDWFANKLAFTVLLNFPLTTLQERLDQGPGWSRRQWAEARLAQRFSKRIPSEVTQAISEAQADAELYINEYKIWTHHVLGEQGQRLFPEGQRLITHWNLRDEIKAQYRDPDQGLNRQRLIQRVMERIVDQSIPAVAINNPRVDWKPFSNEVLPVSPDRCVGPDLPPCKAGPGAEPDTRYAKWLRVFSACRLADAHSPTTPTLMARRFEDDRQMSEERVKAMLEQLLQSAQFTQTARLIEKRVGRPLEPFDVWYDGFRAPLPVTLAELDETVRKRYPSAEAYRKQMPDLLVRLGFTPERARFLSDRIDVEPSRGTGHAMGGAMRGQPARLRTRVGSQGMDFKGYNIALHEMGHNLEQVFSMNLVDHTLLQGVPNNAFTEALAMVAQGHDLELLGLTRPDASAESLRALNDFWATCEIAGMALVDMAVWHWMYEHPDATPTQLKQATLRLARETWNRYYAPVFGRRDVTLLAVYSHMIRDILYLPDYPVGHLIAFQVEESFKHSGNFGKEFERVASHGNVTPDQWMRHATGAPVGAEAMLKAAGQALEQLAGAP